jgi:hypothetical protein
MEEYQLEPSDVWPGKALPASSGTLYMCIEFEYGIK